MTERMRTPCPRCGGTTLHRFTDEQAEALGVPYACRGCRLAGAPGWEARPAEARHPGWTSTVVIEEHTVWCETCEASMMHRIDDVMADDRGPGQPEKAWEAVGWSFSTGMWRCPRCSGARQPS